ncbi:MAG: hypothetical protein HY801_15930, partial [Candidatus Lindowbacteria bacterium]|nr:hypothetical protein [Candidatus Lindowbacteria bacterium]
MKIDIDSCDRLTVNGVIVLLIFMPLAFGAVHPWAFSLAELMVFSLAGISAARTLEKGCFVFALPVAWPFMGVLLLLIMAQMVPMPQRALEFFSPTTVLIGRAAANSSTTGGFNTLSLYPRATVGAFLKVTAFVALSAIVTNVFRTERQLGKLALAIMCVGFAVALVGLLQQRAGAEGIYGFWRSRYWKVGQGSFFGTFVNKNHFAGYMEMAIPMTVALVLRENTHRRSRGLLRLLVDSDSRIFRSFLALFCASIMLWAFLLSGSAGGVASLAVASFAVLFCLSMQRTSGKSRGLLLMCFLLVCVVILVGASRLSPFLLSMVDSARLNVWRDSLRTALEFRWFGAGLGAFRQVFPVYQTL